MVIPSRARIYAVLVRQGTKHDFQCYCDLPEPSRCGGVNLDRVTATGSTVPIVPVQMHGIEDLDVRGEGSGEEASDPNQRASAPSRKFNAVITTNATSCHVLSPPSPPLLASDVFEPFEDFVFSSYTQMPPEEGRERTLTVDVKKGVETFVGVMFWWTLDALEEGGNENTYSSRGGFQDHWPCSLFVIPKKRRWKGDGKGGKVELVCCHDETNVWFDVKEKIEHEESSEGPNKKAKISPTPTPKPPVAAFSASRLRMMNSESRMAFFQHALQEISNTPERSVLDVSDFSLISLMAAKMKFKNVTSIESSANPAVALSSFRTAQLGNGMTNPEEFQILQASSEAVGCKDLLGGKPANVIVGEGWYEKMETNIVWGFLNYYYIIRGLRRRGAISCEDVVYIPRKFKVMGAAVMFEDLSKSYKNVKDCCGFDHKLLDKCGAGKMQEVSA